MADEAEIKKAEGVEEGAEGGDVKKESENRLYVGKLNVITNEDKLKKYFEDYGEVEDCFIMRFPDTRKSKCFGFITFKREEDLVDALDGDHVVDENKLELRKAVPRGKSDAEVFKKERAKYVGSKMYVGNLTEETTAEDLEQFFNSMGKVVDSFIMKDSLTGKSKKFGFVTFEDVPTMEKCLEEKPHSINGTEVEIRRAAPKKDPYGNIYGKRKFEDDDDDIIEGEHVELRRLYVGSLPLSASEDEVKEYFEKFGKVIECILQKNKATNKSKGMAFITFGEAKTVNEIQASQPHKMDNKTLDSRRPAPKGVHPKDPEVLAVTKKLWFGGVNDVISDEDIKEYFEQYGTVEDVEVPLDSEEKKRGFGFVTFNSSDTVDKLILIGHHKIKGRRMDVKKGLDKKEMAAIKRQREQEFMQNQFRYGGGPGPRGMRMGGGGGFGRGAKAMRMAGGGGAGFGRGGASGRVGPDGKKQEILSKIDAIYDNIAQLNQLTNDPSVGNDFMSRGFGGGGMGGGRGGGFGGGKGNYGHTYGGGNDRMGGFSSDSFDEGFGGGYGSGGGYGNGGGGYGNGGGGWGGGSGYGNGGGGYGSGGGGYGSGGGGFGSGGGGYGNGGGGYGSGGGGYGSGGGYGGAGGGGAGFGNGRGFGNGGSMGGFKSGGSRGGGSSYGNKRGGYGGAPNYEDY